MPKVIFLDDGGVMNDNDRRAEQWRLLVGAFLSSKLGGDSVAWGEANRIVFERQWRRYEEHAATLAADVIPDYIDFFDDELERWLVEMCEHVGVAGPGTAAARRELAQRTNDYVRLRLDCAFPGAAEAIRSLHEMGYLLGTASGESSSDLQFYLETTGVRELFTLPLYGPDLIGVSKEHPQYHARLFADAGVDPASVILVDDSPQQVQRAAAAGARTVLVAADGNGSSGQPSIQRLADLPRLLLSL